MENDVTMQKKWFQPVNGMQSTCSLIKTLNTSNYALTLFPFSNIYDLLFPPLKALIVFGNLWTAPIT